MENITLQLTAGQGPEECSFVVAQVLKTLMKSAREKGLAVTVLSREKGEEKNTLKSALVQLEGTNCEEFSKHWIGTIQWVGQSPYRKFHKRKNWFVGVNVLETSDKNRKSDGVKDSDIKYETFRGGGPGGQHVNKVETAVRAIHISTGKTAVAKDSKSQLQNKKAAKAKLLIELKQEKMNAIIDMQQESWLQHTELERGNPIQTFKGSNFKPNHESKSFKGNRKELKQQLKRELKLDYNENSE